VKKSGWSAIPSLSVLLLSLLYLLGFRGCGGGTSGSGPVAPPPDGGALRRGFDGDRAFALLQTQVNFGPRVPGTQAHEETLNFLFAELSKVTDRQEKQTFEATLEGKPVRLTNIIGVIDPATDAASSNRLLLGAHWDCRPVADRDPDPANRAKPIDGANDGASGVALLLEAARLLSKERPLVQVIIVFFDAEDSARLEEMFLGSKYFAAHLDGYKANQGIIVDMVGDANLNLNREQNSLQANAPLYQAILRAAEELGFGEHFTGRAMLITDDHIPLINAGIPTIDLIDFEYPDSSNRYWHTLEDTVDKCSPESLMIVGETILRVVYQLK